MDRTLRFYVRREALIKDWNSRFDSVRKGTKSYLKAEFDFSENWKSADIYAVFNFANGKEEAVKLEDNVCNIPDIVAAQDSFDMYIFGINTGSGSEVKTNSVTIELL